MLRRALLALSAAAAAVDALYFYLPEGSSKCFMEEVPPETLFVGNYKNPDFVPFGSPGCTGSVGAGDARARARSGGGRWRRRRPAAAAGGGGARRRLRQAGWQARRQGPTAAPRTRR